VGELFPLRGAAEAPPTSPAVAAEPRAPEAPRSWLDLADPGLAALQSPPAPGAAILETLLSDADAALPPPPTAS